MSNSTWLQIRLPKSEKQAIARAARAADLTVTDLTRKSALAAADAILDEGQPDA